MDVSGVSVSDAQKAQNYEVLSATTLDANPCYTHLKLGCVKTSADVNL